MAESELIFPSIFESKFEVSDTVGKKSDISEIGADDKKYVLNLCNSKSFIVFYMYTLVSMLVCMYYTILSTL